MKICGITREADAEAAVEDGASALGFVFWPASPRRVDPARARQICRQLTRPVKTVGVFVNQTAEEINRVADLAGLSLVQLHGDEDPEFASRLERPVIKAVSTNSGAFDVAGWPEDVWLLVDAHDPIRRGGTGRGADWQAAAALASERQVLLAGGLTPENVGAAVAAVRPFGIDVSSGVELAPGIKDLDKLRELFRALGEK